jgi:hypothetical protein
MAKGRRDYTWPGLAERARFEQTARPSPVRRHGFDGPEPADIPRGAECVEARSLGDGQGAARLGASKREQLAMLEQPVRVDEVRAVVIVGAAAMASSNCASVSEAFAIVAAAGRSGRIPSKEKCAAPASFRSQPLASACSIARRTSHGVTKLP